MYNSSANYNQCDSDITLISSPSFCDLDETSIIASMPARVVSQQVKTSSEITQSIASDVSFDGTKQMKSMDNHDYTFLEHEMIEQILYYYQQELRQESNTQLDCTRKLVIRLVDFIRPCYASNQRKMKDLDELFSTISNMHDKKCFQQKEKTLKLENEISRLENFIITSANPYSAIASLYETIDNEEWTKLEEETRKLQTLVEYQRNQINELIKLMPKQELFENKTQPTSTCLIISPLPRKTPHNVRKKCCLCNYEYPLVHTEVEIQNHLETCLYKITSDTQDDSVASVNIDCPFCDKKLLNNGDSADLHHMTMCCSQSNVVF
ncbi:unnamed protein product [Rotaria socialis]|uniref:Uncharacterized protein n=1 Tax=Rotaria socialis TaxID=392032 RepID=A0A821FZ49_9BILA|nr:unnamed protein product [Rotaria socialis]CAF4658269.1 unnamed protein product [Rotaria socialis]